MTMSGLNNVNWSQLLSPETDILHDVSFKILIKDVSKNKNGAGYNDKNGKKDPIPDGLVVQKEQHDEVPKIDIVKNCGNTGGDSCVNDSSQSSVHSTRINSVDFEPNEATPKFDSQTVLTAHKLLLASVSSVFRRQFYGSLPAGEVVMIEDSPVKAFKMMIDYIYQNTAGECVENLVEVHELFDTFYLAKEKILNRLSVIPVDLSNYEVLVSCLLKYSYFEDACQVLEKRVIKFIKLHEIPLELAQGAIVSKNYDIKHEVLTKLVSVDEKFILETVKAAHDIFKSEGCKFDETKLLRPVMMTCVQRFEDLKQDPLKLSQFFPNPDSDLQAACSLLFQYLKNKFCKNCESSACKQGESVDISKVKVGVCVVVNSDEKGAVSGVGLVKVNTQKSYGYVGRLLKCNGTPCSSSCPCRKVYTYCPHCKSQGQSLDASVSCNGVHYIKPVYSIQLDSGQEVISTDAKTFLFDC